MYSLTCLRLKISFAVLALFLCLSLTLSLESMYVCDFIRAQIDGHISSFRSRIWQFNQRISRTVQVTHIHNRVTLIHSGTLHTHTQFHCYDSRPISHIQLRTNTHAQYQFERWLYSCCCSSSFSHSRRCGRFTCFYLIRFSEFYAMSNIV